MEERRAVCDFSPGLSDMSPDILSVVALHLSFLDCVHLQLVSRSFLAGFRRVVVWTRFGAVNYQELIEKAPLINRYWRHHLWSLMELPFSEISSTSNKDIVVRRLTQEYVDAKIKGAQPYLLFLGPVDAKVSMTVWKAVLRGPEGSPFSGGVFVLDITVPAVYPFKPPHVVFRTKVFHPNISSRGGVRRSVV